MIAARRVLETILFRTTFCFTILVFNIFTKSASADPDRFAVTIRSNSQVVNPATRDAMFFAMATGGGSKTSELNLQIELQYDLKLFAQSDNTSAIQFIIQSISVNGQTNYRGFDLSDFFTPDLVLGHIEFETDHGVYSRNFNEKFSVAEPVNLLSIDMQTNNEAPLIRKASIELLGFSDDAKKSFLTQIRLVDRYWATISLNDTVYRNILRYSIDDSDDISSLFVYFDLTAKVSRLGNELLADSRLRLRSNDPGKLADETDKVSRMHLRLETLLKQQILKEKNHYDNADVFARKYVAYLERYRLLSEMVSYSGSEQFYYAGRLLPTASFCQLLTYIDKTRFNGAAAQSIYRIMIRKGDSLTHEGNLAHALDYLNDAKDLSENIASIEVDRSVDLKIGKLKEGLLHSFILIATRTVSSDRPDLTQLYLEKAIDFKKEHLNLEQSINIESIIDPLIRAMTDKTKTLIYYGQNNEAIELNNKALHFVNSFNAIPHYWPIIRQQLKTAHTGIYQDLLNTARDYYDKHNYQLSGEYAEYAYRYRIDHIDYLEDQRGVEQLQVQLRKPQISNLIGSGMNEMAHGNHSTALNAFDKANELRKAEGSALDASLDSLRKTAIKNMIISSLRSVDLKIWANELEEASMVYDEAMEKTKEFGFHDDPDIKAAFRRMEEKLTDRICMNNRLEFEELLYRVKRSANQGKLEEVRKNLDRAEKISSLNPGCFINTSELMMLSDRFKDAFNFKDQYQLLYNRMFEIGFSAVVADYDRLDSLYSLLSTPNDVYRPTSLMDFLADQNNPSLSLTACSYFAGKNKAIAAIQCLKMFKKQGGTEKQTREIQLILARQTARLTLLEGIHEYRLKTVDDFVENDPWYKVFRQEFTKMRKLAGE